MAELSLVRQRETKDYAKEMRRPSFLEVGLGGLAILILLFSTLSIGLRDVLGFPQPARVAISVATLMTCCGIASAALSFCGGFVLPRRFSLSVQNLRGWLLGEVKAGALGFLLGIGVMVFPYWLLGDFPNSWWLLAAFLILLTVVMTKLTNQNLSGAQPSRWVEPFLGDHPPYFKREARARHYEEGAK